MLTPQNNWTLGDDAAVCAGATPADRLTATFAAGWQNSSTGALAAGGKLDVAYDIYRMPQILGCTTDGVNAFATLASVQFEPGGQIQSEVVERSTRPHDRRVHEPAARVRRAHGHQVGRALVEASSDCTAAYWDSDYGQNYVFRVP